MLDVYICIITVTAFEFQIFICNLWTIKLKKKFYWFYKKLCKQIFNTSTNPLHMRVNKISLLSLALKLWHQIHNNVLNTINNINTCIIIQLL